MANKMLDFDNFLSEQTQEFMDIKLFGKTWKVPNSIPAFIPLSLARAEKDKNASSKLTMQAAETMLGKKFVEEVAKHPEFSAQQLGELMRQIFRLVRGLDPAGTEEEGEDGEGETLEENGGGVVAKGTAKKR